VAALQIQNSSGATLAASAAGATSLSYTVTNADAYFVSINSISNSAGLTALYLLTIDLMDTAPPAVTSLTLPGGSTTCPSSTGSAWNSARIWTSRSTELRGTCASTTGTATS